MIMALKIYNSFNSSKEEFKPITDDHVGMYVCGPTVYGDPHLGHARSSICFDIVVRYLRFIGYKVRFVRNITDVGHLENDADEGEDKILKKARIEQMEPMEVAQQYTNVYRKSMEQLNCLAPSIEPTASGHIPDQIETIQKIMQNGFAYEINGSVYFNIKAYANKYFYGQLSGRVLEELKAISREDLEGSNEKLFHADFALWKKANPQHVMQWNSPWGKGFPGWHIECTAMSSKYLGIPFDIHGGGMDLKFPHHEAEICQSLGAFNKQPVNYWMHNNMVTIDGQKMAKSKGNYITLEEMFSGNNSLLAKAFSPMVVRFFILQAHYRSTIDFSNESLIAAEIAYKKLTKVFNQINELNGGEITTNIQLEDRIKLYCLKCSDAMNDDFNTAETIAALFELSKISNVLLINKEDQNQLSKSTIQLLQTTYQNYFEIVLGLDHETDNSTKFESNVLLSIIDDIRNEAKTNRNFELADTIRIKLKNIGISLNDNKNGATTYSFEQ